MKVNIDYKGNIIITPENPMEYFALMHVQPKAMCGSCQQAHLPVVIDCSECGPVLEGNLAKVKDE